MAPIKVHRPSLSLSLSLSCFAPIAGHLRRVSLGFDVRQSTPSASGFLPCFLSIFRSGYSIPPERSREKWIRVRAETANYERLYSLCDYGNRQVADSGSDFAARKIEKSTISHSAALDQARLAQEEKSCDSSREAGEERDPEDKRVVASVRAALFPRL